MFDILIDMIVSGCLDAITWTFITLWISAPFLIIYKVYSWMQKN
jgi:hypothetical protein